MTFLGSKNKSPGGRCPFVPCGYMPDSMAGRTCETGVCDALQARRRERTNVYIDNDTEAMDTYIIAPISRAPCRSHSCWLCSRIKNIPARSTRGYLPTRQLISSGAVNIAKVSRLRHQWRIQGIGDATRYAGHTHIVLSILYF